MRKARRQAHFNWAVGVVAPWVLGAGLLAASVADAGQEIPAGASLAPLSSKSAAVIPADLAPPPQFFAASFGERSGRGLLREARLIIGGPDQLSGQPDEEIEPRKDLKKGAAAFPEIDRRHKGDPVVGLRPTIDGRLRQQNAVTKMRSNILTFGQDESGLASTFTPGDGDAPGPDSVASFEAWQDGETPVTEPSAGGSSPSAGAGALTMRPAAVAERIAQGASPAVPRAAALASSTPFAADQTPVEANLAALAPARRGPAARIDEKRGYLALLAPERADAEKRCLAQAIYFEARSEPVEGQAAVAQVILNRMTSGLYPSTICGVVFQNRSHYRACQFSFACEGKSLRIVEAESWAQATRVANEVLEGRTWLADVGGSTHYHANYVRPRWARSLKKTDTIGRHIFYRLKSG
ncbi:cell wall hydrolase [Rhodoblastus sp. 17X3]|uniref:cell wall hydrolase n=1 Tax=Rhodoblastus sp. 17X3 TaxID=3047026 RepID=UPI0024B6B2BF|nr:cell wall hydrolase [Rhodoblastus sp. 17X3]MDI9848634.1 cell wall hydrolase [Rhodoblastus sp. 17X3]